MELEKIIEFLKENPDLLKEIEKKLKEKRTIEETLIFLGSTEKVAYFLGEELYGMNLKEEFNYQPGSVLEVKAELKGKCWITPIEIKEVGILAPEELIAKVKERITPPAEGIHISLFIPGLRTEKYFINAPLEKPCIYIGVGRLSKTGKTLYINHPLVLQEF